MWSVQVWRSLCRTDSRALLVSTRSCIARIPLSSALIQATWSRHFKILDSSYECCNWDMLTRWGPMLRTTQVKEASRPLITVTFSITEPKVGSTVCWIWCWPAVPIQNNWFLWFFLTPFTTSMIQKTRAGKMYTYRKKKMSSMQLRPGELAKRLVTWLIKNLF